MIQKFADGEGNIISEANQEIVMMYARRLIVNGFPSGCNEGDHVLVFTEENLEKIFKHFNDKLVETMKELLKTKEEYSELLTGVHKKIEEMEKENQNLKLLNNQLTLQIMDLKE